MGLGEIAESSLLLILTLETPAPDRQIPSKLQLSERAAPIISTPHEDTRK